VEPASDRGAARRGGRGLMGRGTLTRPGGLSGIMPDMSKPFLRLFAALGLLALVALIAAGCRPVDLKTYVMGPLACEPETKRPDRCDACMKASCCAEYRACANAAPCPCWLQARLAAAPPADALGICGAQNEAYKALAACLNRCPWCPIEDAITHHVMLGK